MKFFFKSILYLLSIALVLFSCTNDDHSNSKSTKVIDLESKAGINPIGHIVSKENEPIYNVSIIKNGRIIATSEEDGSFNVKKAELKSGDVLSFEHTDYVTVTKVLNDNSALIIFMQNRAEPIRIDSKKDNKITLEKGGYIIIPKNTLGIKNKPFMGEVNIRASYIDVTNSFELRSAPGSYIAQGEKGLYPLTSFGMIEIVATIPEKDLRLDVVRGKNISIGLPIISPEETPKRINLYSFDRLKGYWQLNGVLENNGDVLLGEVTSINSAWNADQPCSSSLVCIKFKVTYTNGTPSPGCYFAAKGLSYNGFDGLQTIGSDGYVRLNVCPNSAFELQACVVCPICPGSPYTTTIDLSTISTPPGPDGCIDIGTFTVNN